MTFSLRHLFLLLAPVAAAVAANTSVSTDKPILNFRSATFTTDGFRSWLIRGTEARVQPDNRQITIKELTLSIFPGKADNEKVETMILSPTAEVLPADSVVTGKDSIRVLNDDFEATGTDWRYLHKEKRVLIAADVHVTFRSELKDFLK